jgi:hypothetical protein
MLRWRGERRERGEAAYKLRTKKNFMREISGLYINSEDFITI